MMGLDFGKEGELMAVQKKLMMTEKAMMMEKQMMMFKQKQMMMNKQKEMMMRRQKEKMLKKQKQPAITRLQPQARILTQKSIQSQCGSTTMYVRGGYTKKERKSMVFYQIPLYIYMYHFFAGTSW